MGVDGELRFFEDGSIMSASTSLERRSDDILGREEDSDRALFK